MLKTIDAIAQLKQTLNKAGYEPDTLPAVIDLARIAVEENLHLHRWKQSMLDLGQQELIERVCIRLGVDVRIGESATERLREFLDASNK